MNELAAIEIYFTIKLSIRLATTTKNLIIEKQIFILFCSISIYINNREIKKTNEFQKINIKINIHYKYQGELLKIWSSLSIITTVNLKVNTKQRNN